MQCFDCGKRMKTLKRNKEYWCDNCKVKFVMDFDIPYDLNIPEGCVACGGPYPDCTTSCKLFDD